MNGKAWLGMLGAATLVLSLLVYSHAARPAPSRPEGPVADPAGRLDQSQAREPGQTPCDADLLVQSIMARVRVKIGLAEDVRAGRLSLLEAAAAFRDLGAQGPPDHILIGFPSASSEDEAYCRSVISYVAAQAPPGQVTDLTRGLERELDARLRDRTLHLQGPDPIR